MNPYAKVGSRFRIFVVMAGLMALMYAPPSLARVNVDINIGVPPPPAVVFPSPPEVVVIPNTQVYYVPTVSGYDMYRFGPYWYINRDGYWYRSRQYRGPFTVIAYAHVPRAIVVVPPDFRHHPLHPHGGPPGHLKHFDHGEGPRHGRHED